MTQLVWDEVGERRFETGVDHGVLYLREGGAVPWNGLVEVAESRTVDVKPFYQDGIKYLEHHVPGSFGAKLKAYTYPDELDALIGITEWAPGVDLHDQRGAQLFSLSYRTRVGNDLEGVEHGYKIHLLYNIVASPSDFAHSTTDSNVSVQPMEWNLSGIPVIVAGIRPTAHISLDSRRIDPELLSDLEEQIYGTEETDPQLPELLDLMAMVIA